MNPGASLTPTMGGGLGSGGNIGISPNHAANASSLMSEGLMQGMIEDGQSGLATTPFAWQGGRIGSTRSYSGSGGLAEGLQSVPGATPRPMGVAQGLTPTQQYYLS